MVIDEEKVDREREIECGVSQPLPWRNTETQNTIVKHMDINTYTKINTDIDVFMYTSG